MYNNLINLFEDIKLDKYTSFEDYLTEEDVEKVSVWFHSFSEEQNNDFEKIIDLMYVLYVREDIDLRPYEEFNRLAVYYAEKYSFKTEDFLNLYISFRKMLFE